MIMSAFEEAAGAEWTVSSSLPITLTVDFHQRLTLVAGSVRPSLWIGSFIIDSTPKMDYMDPLKKEPHNPWLDQKRSPRDLWIQIGLSTALGASAFLAFCVSQLASCGVFLTVIDLETSVERTICGAQEAKE